jgi:hypothetical protein
MQEDTEIKSMGTLRKVQKLHRDNPNHYRKDV